MLFPWTFVLRCQRGSFATPSRGVRDGDGNKVSPCQSGVNRGQREHKGSLRDINKIVVHQHPHIESGQSPPLNYPP